MRTLATDLARCTRDFNSHSEDEHTCTKKRKHCQKAKRSRQESFRHASDSEDLDVPMDGIVEGVGSLKDGSMV